MKVGIIGGTGKLGFALAKRLIELEYNVVIGSRSKDRGIEKASMLNSSLLAGGSNFDAVQADVVVFSIPFDQVEILLLPLKEHLKGKIIIDMMNNLKFGKHPSAVLHAGKSTYECVKEWFPESEVVAMLKTVSHTMLQNKEPINQTDFQITSSDEAYKLTSRLAIALGMTPVRIIGDYHGHTIERMVALAIQINKTYPGSHVGFELTSLENSNSK